MSKDTGGPAFPARGGTRQFRDVERGAFTDKVPDYPGMTLHDYFAAKASDDDIKDMLPRVPKIKITYTNVDTGVSSYAYDYPLDVRQIARYMHADAMLAERSK